jgi:hypothetical protein
MLLESLTLTFEGQSELLIPSAGYCPLRLCAESHEIAPAGGPFEFTNEGHEDSNEPCTWNVVFSIPIPGWLPATADFGDELNGGQAGISYSLYASAKLTVIDENASNRSFFSFANLCSVFSSRTRTVNAPRRDITISRVMNAPIPSPFDSSSNQSIFDKITYTAIALSECRAEERNETHIPLDVLEKIRFYVSAPESVAIDEEKSLPFTVKLAAEGMPEDECSRLRVTGFTADIEQYEKYR